MIEGMGPDVETKTEANGAKQSDLKYRFDLIDGPALFKMASVLHEGAEKYGADNWRGIKIEDHLNHMIAHAYAYLAGDTSDDHLSHIMCRAMFAQATHVEPNKDDIHVDERVYPPKVKSYEVTPNYDDLLRWGIPPAAAGDMMEVQHNYGLGKPKGESRNQRYQVTTRNKLEVFELTDKGWKFV